MAVKRISFAVRRGEHLTLLGPSGCGKTTTLRAIAGLEQPSAGEIRIDGQAVYVTYDQEEALAISDRVIVMHAGSIEQISTPNEIYDTPRSAFVADFVGAANLISGTLRHDLAREGIIVLETASGALVHGRENGRHVGTAGAFSVRTVYPWLSRAQPNSPVNTWQVRISRRVFLGDFVQYLVDWEGNHLVVRRPPTESPARGLPA